MADEIQEEDQDLIDSIFEQDDENLGNIGQMNFNVQPSAPHPPSHNTQPPGVMQPTTMHNDSISPVPTITSTEGTPVAPIGDQYDLERMNIDEVNDLFDEDFEYNEANYQPAGQPMQGGQTQPTPGVTNMTGGTVSDGGDAPNTNTPNESNIEDRTEGGTTGTTPSSTPYAPGYGQGSAPSGAQTVNDESIDELFEDQEDDLSFNDEKLISEFDSLA